MLDAVAHLDHRHDFSSIKGSVSRITGKARIGCGRVVYNAMTRNACALACQTNPSCALFSFSSTTTRTPCVWHPGAPRDCRRYPLNSTSYENYQLFRGSVLLASIVEKDASDVVDYRADQRIGYFSREDCALQCQEMNSTVCAHSAYVRVCWTLAKAHPSIEGIDLKFLHDDVKYFELEKDDSASTPRSPTTSGIATANQNGTNWLLVISGCVVGAFNLVVLCYAIYSCCIASHRSTKLKDKTVAVPVESSQIQKLNLEGTSGSHNVKHVNLHPTHGQDDSFASGSRKTKYRFTKKMERVG